MEKHNDNTLNTVLYQKVSGCYKQVAKSSRYLIYRFSYGKKLYFSSADDEGTGITCTYTKGKNGFKVVYHNGLFLLLQNIESIDIPFF
jgi:hypothetical protein